MRTVGLELLVHPVERTRNGRIRNRGSYHRAAPDAFQLPTLHEPLDRAAGDSEAFAVQRAPNRVGPIDLHVGLPYPLNLQHQEVIVLGTRTAQGRVPPLGGMAPIAGRGDLHHLGLSACLAALHGRAATPRLGPVGLGPALIAAGARRVIGPLWRCNQVATWLFQQLLYETAAACPERPWSWRLARARTQLRGLSLAETTDRLQAGLGERYRELDFWDLEDPPFANPYYWAPFILLGDDGPWPQPGAADPRSRPAPRRG